MLLFSGGLDSSLLLAAAAPVLGPGLTALTFTGPHTVPGELAGAFALARRLLVRHLVRETDPLVLPDFQHNTRQRCYACKKAIIEKAREMAADLGIEEIWDGTNLDDLADFRPGLQAARELGVKSPLLEAGLGKAAIRDLSRQLGLAWDRPPQSCLATRFPYDTQLTRETLALVGRAESWLRRRGFTYVRLRISGGRARLELTHQEWRAFLAPEVHRPFTALAARMGWMVELDAGGGGLPPTGKPGALASYPSFK
ncbi:MAG: ATP-dependent sacrificial sulfur transferase LarE [Deltaproteobacteria bacterium]|nr:ATP-dependent sacrificial sulfur transferase LarE [Deltaproteobacteria bacterium]MBI4794836.1 ATP-dependent sacrificial sulfur transferase LarE [Deltaproteobacteria bacterium]